MTEEWARFSQQFPEEYDLLFDVVTSWLANYEDRGDREYPEALQAFYRRVVDLSERMGVLEDEE